MIRHCATLPAIHPPTGHAPATPPSDPAIADTLYQAALAYLALISTSEDAAQMSLAFFGAAATLARVLRAPRTLRDWGARVVVLAVVAQAALVDDAAALQLLSEGMLATVELSLHVRFSPCASSPPASRCRFAHQLWRSA